MQFTVILENVEESRVARRNMLNIFNRRTVSMDADNIDAAWVEARRQYYELQIEGPTTQIVDIKEGDYELPEQTPAQEAAAPVEGEETKGAGQETGATND